MKYITVCAKETDEFGTQRFVIDKPFVELALGRDVTTEKPTQDETIALEEAVRTFLGGINVIVEHCVQRGIEIVIDEFGRPQVLEDANRENYFVE